METQTTKRPRIGFKYWKNEEENFVEESINLTANPIEQINNVQGQANNNSSQILLTNAHMEVLERIEMVEKVILGKEFGKYSNVKKKEFLAEQNFLKELHNQLIKSY